MSFSFYFYYPSLLDLIGQAFLPYQLSSFFHRAVFVFLPEGTL